MLYTLNDNMKGLKNLRFLDLSMNGLEKLPEVVTSLIALQELYLNDTSMEFLPANFGRLVNLRILELRENPLLTLPKSISRLTALQRLDIGQNEFSELVSKSNMFAGDCAPNRVLWLLPRTRARERKQRNHSRRDQPREWQSLSLFDRVGVSH